MMMRKILILFVMILFLISFASAICGNGICEVGETVENCPVDCFYFGIAFGTDYAFKKYGGDSLQFIREAGATDMGIHVFWSSLEPENNNYDWSIIDSYINQIQVGDNAHIMVFTDGFCTEGGKNYKGSPLNESHYTLNCTEEYRNFIHDLAIRTNGKVKYWQRDIEPATTIHWPYDRADEYVELQQIFYEEIKLVIPDTLIGGLGLAGSEISLQQELLVDYFFQNAENYFDYLDVHLYKDKYKIPDGINSIKNMMNFYGYEKPLIIKESGGPTSFEYEEEYELMRLQIQADCASDPECICDWLVDNFESIDPKIQIFLINASSEQNAKRDRIECKDMTQRNLIMLEQGAKKIFWWNLLAPWDPFCGPHPIFGKLRLLDESHNKLSPFYCYQRMTDKFENISSVERIILSDTSIYFYKINKSNSNKPMYVIWHHDEDVDSYDDDTTPSVSAEIPVELFGIVNITNVFGISYTQLVSGGNLILNVDNTPIFIEELITCNNNTICEAGETNSNCPLDCYCGDGVCWIDEGEISCLEDCEEPTEICEDLRGICKTNTCNTYTNCTSLIGICASGYCCLGTCTTQTYNPADINQDNEIDITELMDYIGEWKAGNVNIVDLMAGITIWKAGGY